MPAPTPRRIAVVGSGIAGLTAAHVASRNGSAGNTSSNGVRVTLFEADSRLGGHADTHLVTDPAGRELRIDSGFIVHNRRTYPVLIRLFDELGVPTQASEMSMSISDEGTGLEWAGALGRRGVFPAGARNHRNPAYLRMLTEIPRFHRQARRLLDQQPDPTAATAAGTTLATFLDEGGFSPYFRRHFMEPLVAAVWSCDPTRALDYPAAYLFAFLQHHGMLQVFRSPPWRTVTGGSRTYVDKLAAAFRAAGGEIRLGSPVVSVSEQPHGVEITTTGSGREEYDAVVIATHPDQALGMLADPTPLQAELLRALPYEPNTALLHTDGSLMPSATDAWASWNFRRPRVARDGVQVTYDLTRLQRLPTDTHYLVTLGAEDLVDPATVLVRRDYAHPLYTPTSVAARARLSEIDSDRVVFAGAYHGWGFHEDGARSGLRAVERLGLSWPPGLVGSPEVEEVAQQPGSPEVEEVAQQPGSPEVEEVAQQPGSPEVEEVAQQPSRDPGTSLWPRSQTSAGGLETAAGGLLDHRPTAAGGLLDHRPTAAGGLLDHRPTPATSYDTTLVHTRREPLRNSFRIHSRLWVVDLDRVADSGAIDGGRGRFLGRDHFDGDTGSVREGLDRFLARHGLDLRGGRALMAAHPRAFGHCFNPISVHWCWADASGSGRPAATVVEVHNTYGDRHAYLVDVDERGRGRVDKAMYVSPFHGTDGHYEVLAPPPHPVTGRLRLGVRLVTGEGARFDATLTGEPGERPTLPLAGLRGAALIRAHGIALWARRLPVQPRPRPRSTKSSRGLETVASATSSTNAPHPEVEEVGHDRLETPGGCAGPRPQTFSPGLETVAAQPPRPTGPPVPAQPPRPPVDSTTTNAPDHPKEGALR